MESPTDPSDTSNELDSLEEQTTVMENQGGLSSAGPSAGLTPPVDSLPPVVKKRRSFRRFLGRFNIYLLLFILLLIVAAIISMAAYTRSRDNSDKPSALSTEPLSQEALAKLKTSDVRVGEPKQLLTVAANAIFDGKVLIRDDLEVAGQIKVGGPLSLPGITVAGTSNFDQVQLNNLQVAGNTTIQGQLSLQKGLTVAGSGSFAGSLSASQLTVESLQISRDLQLGRHIDAGGGTPGISSGGALGSGGTTSISGTDTAGTVNINTGGGAGNGCFATITFTQRFGGTPHVVITPVGSSGGGVNYYINRSATSFSICAVGGASGSFAFDYLVID